MKQTTYPRCAVFLTTATLTTTLAGAGCGFTELFNQEVQKQELQIITEAGRQALWQTGILVTDSLGRAAQAAPRCEALPMSTCQVCFTPEGTGQSLALAGSSVGCALPTPPQGLAVGMELTLRSLQHRTQVAAPGVLSVTGQGSVHVSASLPVFGAYRALASYQVDSGVVQTADRALDLQLTLLYAGEGEKDPLKLQVHVHGTPEALQGTLQTPNGTCQISGSLTEPQLSC